MKYKTGQKVYISPDISITQRIWGYSSLMVEDMAGTVCTVHSYVSGDDNISINDGHGDCWTFHINDIRPYIKINPEAVQKKHFFNINNLVT